MGPAKAVAPGELQGIDMEEPQIEMARAAAAADGHDNAFFRTGVEGRARRDGRGRPGGGDSSQVLVRT